MGRGCPAPAGEGKPKTRTKINPKSLLPSLVISQMKRWMGMVRLEWRSHQQPPVGPALVCTRKWMGRRGQVSKKGWHLLARGFATAFTFIYALIAI